MKNIFEHISVKERSKLLNILGAHTISFKKNQDISVSVNDINTLCIVLEGYLQIIKTDSYGNRTIIEEVFDNEVFGSVISNIGSYEYSIITKEDSTIITLDYNNVFSKSNVKYSYFSEFVNNLLLIYQEKMKLNSDRIEILTNKTIRDKLLAYFNKMAKGSNARIVYLPYSFTDLADYLAVNRSAMSRELSNLKDEGLIEVNGKKIKLLYYL